MTALAFAIGATVSLLAGFSSTLMPGGAAVVLIIFAPILEEGFRAASLFPTVLQMQRVSALRLGLFHGVGFGLAEAIPRWLDASSLPFVLLIGTLVPFALHITLSVIVAVNMRRILVATMVCIAIHAAHNGYVAFAVSNYTPSQYNIDVMARLLLILGVLTSLMREPRP